MCFLLKFQYFVFSFLLEFFKYNTQILVILGVQTVVFLH